MVKFVARGCREIGRAVDLIELQATLGDVEARSELARQSIRVSGTIYESNKEGNIFLMARRNLQ